MYPVETEITQLYTLDGDSQLKILAGDRQGQIHCFTLLWYVHIHADRVCML